MRRIYLVLVAIVALLPSCSYVRGIGPIKIGAIYPTGGSQGPGGIEEYHGAQLAAELFNLRGGLRGRSIDLDLQRTDRAEEVPGATARLMAKGIKVWLGSYGSTISRPAAAVAKKVGSLFWETGAVGFLDMAGASSERVFRFPATGSQLGRASVDFMRNQFVHMTGRKDGLRYSVVYVDDVYGRSVGVGAEAAIKEFGLAMGTVIPYKLPDVDFDSIARQIQQAKTDILVVSAYLEDGIAMREAMVKAKIPLVASIGTSSSYCHLEFGKRLAEDAVGLFASDKPSGDVLRTDGLSQAAAVTLRWGRERYKKEFGEPMSGPALSGFAGAWALFDYVLPLANSLEPESIASAARQINLPVGSLPNGSGLRFGPRGQPSSGDNQAATSVIWEWVSPGVRAVVWPPQFANESIKVIALS